jgi:hypothetical protein
MLTTRHIQFHLTGGNHVKSLRSDDARIGYMRAG